jgi:hypothetical protein
MTYYGSQMVVENYNVMGVAKAALESAVRYMAAELGPKGIRVHAISPGPLSTRAASGIPEFDELLERAKAPARSLVRIEDVGFATAFLAHDAAHLITGETLYIDGVTTLSISWRKSRLPDIIRHLVSSERIGRAARTGSLGCSAIGKSVPLPMRAGAGPARRLGTFDRELPNARAGPSLYFDASFRN